MPVYSQVVEFSIEPRQQSGLVAALAAVDQRFTRTCPGFITASVQASEDGLRVLHQVLWQSREACEVALRNLEPGVADLQQLIRQHRVKAAVFGSYQVLSQIASNG